MGGSGGKKKTKAPKVETINYEALMRQASMYGAQNSRDQIAALIEAYPQLEALQLGTVDRIAGRLGDSAYTRWAQGETQDASLAATRVTQTGQQQQTLGSLLAQQGMRQLADSGPTSIEQRLYADAERELALGRELSPEQQRAATQSARQAFAARGLGTGMGSAAAEILNRDAYATAREDSRRNFAASANNMQTQNVLARRAGATNEIGLGGNFLANATNAYNMGGALRLNTASAVAGLDPYARALGAAQPYVGNSLNSGGQMVGNAYNNALGMAGDTASFNANAQNWSNFNNYAMRRGGGGGGGGGGMGFNAAGAGMGALSGAASGAMIGSVVPGIGTAVGAIGGGLIGGLGGGLSDRREKTDIKKVDGPTNVIGIPAYEYRYKGEKKKRRGVMAQDVAKVLPEAVTEVDYQGKKRLAIRPAVIGAALARELTEQTKAVAA